MVRAARGDPELERAPSEYIRDHVWFTTQPIEEPDDPDDFVPMVEQGRLADRLLFATGYPHWDFDSPSRPCRAGSRRRLGRGSLPATPVSSTACRSATGAARHDRLRTRSGGLRRALPAGSLDALAPHQDESWVGYIEEAGVALNGRAGGSHPPRVPTSPAAYEELDEQLLGPSEPHRVLLNCVPLYEIHRSPNFSAAVARAINDWLRSD